MRSIIHLALTSALVASPTALSLSSLNLFDIPALFAQLLVNTAHVAWIQELAAAKDGSAALLEALGQAAQNTLTELEKILDPELYYSYGRSPPVYPSPVGNGDSGGWSDAYARARALVAQMTDYEKANITLGAFNSNGCSGFTGTVPRVGFPGLCLNDASSGVRGGQLVNGYASGLSVGASWNRDLAAQRGQAIGREFKAKGVNVLLGPVVGPLGRVTRGGRNWEGFSVDPYLAGSLVEPTISGMQESVVACVKHFIAYEQETNRNPFLLGFLPGLGNQSVSSNLDDRTMHEMYLWPFYDALRAGVGAVMCSYNRINGSQACQNSKTMNGLLKTELGFQGFVVSDWYATTTGVASNNAGLDMVMPFSTWLTPLTLALAVANGSVSASRLDDQATRILAAWFRYADLGVPPTVGDTTTDARDPAADAVILQSAIEGHVLVKNTNNTLPFGHLSALNVFGYDAVGGDNTSSAGLGLGGQSLGNTQMYTAEYGGGPFNILDFGLFGAQVAPSQHAGPMVALNGTLLSGGGSGGITPTSSVPPLDGLTAYAARNGVTLHVDTTSLMPTVADPSAPCLVLVNAQSSETWDRAALDDTTSDTLITHVASQCARTVVVLHNAGTRLVDAWIDLANISSVLFAHVPGQASGDALTALLFADAPDAVSPSGRLPYTVAHRVADYGPVADPSLPTPEDPLYSQSDFVEGLDLDYRHFLAAGIAPRFAFGFGLTYAEFTYGDLSVAVVPGTNATATPLIGGGGSAQNVTQGGADELYDVLAQVSATVRNTGAVPAAEVAQLYLGIPASGQDRVLRGFNKTAALAPQAVAPVSFALRRRDLSIWDTAAQAWRLPSGTFDVYVGKSVEDIQLQGTMQL